MTELFLICGICLTIIASVIYTYFDTKKERIKDKKFDEAVKISCIGFLCPPIMTIVGTILLYIISLIFE